METSKNNPKSLRLEELNYFLGELEILALSGFEYIKNEIIQDIKHVYFHITGRKHEKTQRSKINPYSYFEDFKTYVAK